MAKQLDRRGRLERDRDHLEAAIESCESKRDLPALVREHRAVMAEIDALAPPAEQKGDAVDEIAQRRAARGAGSAKSRRRPAANQS